MLDSLQKCNFSNGGRWNTIVITVNSDLLHSNNSFGLLVSGLEHHSVCTFSKFLTEVVSSKSFLFLAETILACRLELSVLSLNVIYHFKFKSVIILFQIFC
jgi:hypothetical protein